MSRFPVALDMRCGELDRKGPSGNAIEGGCGQQLLVEPFYTRESVQKIIDESMAQERFIGRLVMADGAQVGFAWGYQVPRTDMPTVKFSEIAPMLEKLGVMPEDTFYAAEIAVSYEAEQSGQRVGTRVSMARVKAAQEQGFTGVVYRSKNEKIQGIFRTNFGGQLRLLDLKDPTPGRGDDVWGYCSFADFAPKY